MALQSSSRERASESGALRDEISIRLAQANLLRMRACWGEATEACMAVLRLSPGNASAQSLLGDIYENQGRIDDAVQWYRMALDANPESASDRAKLRHLLHVKERAAKELPHSAPATSPASLLPVKPAEADGPSPLALMARLGARFPERLIRWAALGTGALTLIIILVATIVTARQGAPAFTGAGGHEIKADPVLLPPAAGPVAPSASPAPQAGRDPSEDSILASLRASPSLSAVGVSPIDVQVDPRDSEATVTLLCPAAANRAVMLRAALLGAQATAAAPSAPQFSMLTIRCLAPGMEAASDGTAPLGFVADIERANVPASADANRLTPDQIQSLFSWTWWANQVAP